MGYKVIKHWSNEQTGFSMVTIQNKYGTFSGVSTCHDDDIFSPFAGEKYAEIRANLEFAKVRLKQEKIKLNTIKALMKDISINCPDEAQQSKVLRRVKLKLRDYTQSVDDWSNLCHFLESSVDRQDKERQKILSRTKEKKKTI